MFPGGAQRNAAEIRKTVQAHAVGAVALLGLIREPGAKERAVEPHARRVAGKHAARAVRTVRPGGETDDEYPRRRIAECRHGLAPIGLVAILPAPLARDRLAVSAQLGTAPAGDDAALDAGQRVQTRDPSEGMEPENER